MFFYDIKDEISYNQRERLELFLVLCISVIYQPKAGMTFLFSQVYSSSKCQKYGTATAHKPVAES